MNSETEMPFDAQLGSIEGMEMPNSERADLLSFVKSPCFESLCALVSNAIEKYDVDIEETSDADRRLDLLMRKNGCKQVLRSLETIADIALGTDESNLFVPNQEVDYAALRAFSEYPLAKEQLRENWSTLLRSVDSRSERLNLSPHEARNLTSIEIGMKGILRKIVNAI